MMHLRFCHVIPGLILWCIFNWLVLPSGADAEQGVYESTRRDSVQLTLVVRAPESTPGDAVIFVAGNFHSEKAWRADAEPLRLVKDGTYRGTIELSRGMVFKYKITRGSWETVEKDADGHEIPNREIVINHDKTVTIAVQSWADQIRDMNINNEKIKSTMTGHITIHRSFHSQYLKRDRDILVYLPPGYDDDANRRYPVLYMHDGQNVFDEATSFAGVEWGADETAERLITEKRIEPIIIVAINNSDLRMDEYTPTKDAKLGGGDGAAYGRFLVEEVKPFVDGHYRTLGDRLHTGVAGSSLGGLISLYLIWNYPDIFSRAAVISPSLWWNNAHLIRMIEEAKESRLKKDVRIWIDIGTKEGGESYPQDATVHVKRLGAALSSKGLKEGTNYRIIIIEGGEHNESAWAKRFDRVLLYLYGSK